MVMLMLGRLLFLLNLVILTNPLALPSSAAAVCFSSPARRRAPGPRLSSPKKDTDEEEEDDGDGEDEEDVSGPAASWSRPPFFLSPAFILREKKIPAPAALGVLRKLAARLGGGGRLTLPAQP